MKEKEIPQYHQGEEDGDLLLRRVVNLLDLLHIQQVQALQNCKLYFYLGLQFDIENEQPLVFNGWT